jgi:hypothetical protein
MVVEMTLRKTIQNEREARELDSTVASNIGLL